MRMSLSFRLLPSHIIYTIFSHHGNTAYMHTESAHLYSTTMATLPTCTQSQHIYFQPPWQHCLHALRVSTFIFSHHGNTAYMHSESAHLFSAIMATLPTCTQSQHIYIQPPWQHCLHALRVSTFIFNHHGNTAYMHSESAHLYSATMATLPTCTQSQHIYIQPPWQHCIHALRVSTFIFSHHGNTAYMHTESAHLCSATMATLPTCTQSQHIYFQPPWQHCLHAHRVSTFIFSHHGNTAYMHSESAHLFSAIMATLHTCTQSQHIYIQPSYSAITPAQLLIQSFRRVSIILCKH